MGHPVFDFFLCSVVFFNLVVVVAETDYKAEHRKDEKHRMSWKCSQLVVCISVASPTLSVHAMGFEIAIFGFRSCRCGGLRPPGA